MSGAHSTIGLRVAHLVPTLQPCAASSSAINIARWLGEHGHQSLMITTGGERLGDCDTPGVDLYRYRPGGVGWYLKGRRRFVEQIGDWGPDLLHVHRLDALSLGLSVAEDLRLPLIAGLHRVPNDDEIDLLRRPQVGLVIVPTDALRAHCCGRLGLDRDRVVMIPYGIDLLRYGCDEREGPIALAGALGRFDRDQRSGFSVLIQALTTLHAEGCPLRALLVGSGTHRDPLAESIAAAGLAEAVTIEDAPAHTAPVLQRLDVFVYSALHDEVPLAVIKAMAAGRPVVASAVGGVPELIRDGETGILVPAQDAESLAAALRRVVDDPVAARAMGRNARRQIGETYTIQRVGNAIHELYRCAVRARRGGSSTEAVTTWKRHRTGEDDGLDAV